jgi:hypothetical protein
MSVFAEAGFLKTFHAGATVFWLLNFPPIIALYLLVDNETFQNFCLLYLALVSIWANVAGHWSAWQSSRVEVKQDEQ